MRNGFKIILLLVLISAIPLAFIYNERIYRATKVFFVVLKSDARLDEDTLKDLAEMRKTLVALRVRLREADFESAAIKEKYSKEKAELENEMALLADDIRVLKDLLEKAQLANKDLTDDNIVLILEVSNLKEELRLWEGKINSIDEAKYVKTMRKSSIREVKKRIVKFRKEARERIDRINYILGNKGYLVQDGESTLSKESIERRKKMSVVELQQITVEK